MKKDLGRPRRRSEFAVWVVSRSDVFTFVVYEIILSSAVYAGLKRANGHELIAILGSSVSTTVCKKWVRLDALAWWRRGRGLHIVPWPKSPVV